MSKIKIKIKNKIDFSLLNLLKSIKLNIQHLKYDFIK